MRQNTDRQRTPLPTEVSVCLSVCLTLSLHSTQSIISSSRMDCLFTVTPLVTFVRRLCVLVCSVVVVDGLICFD